MESRFSRGVWGLVLQVTKVTSLVTLLQGDEQMPGALGKDFTLAVSAALYSACCPLSALLFSQSRVHERRGIPPSNPDMKEMI